MKSNVFTQVVLQNINEFTQEKNYLKGKILINHLLNVVTSKILVLGHSVHVPKTFSTHLAEVHHFLLAAESKNAFFESTDANLPLVSAPSSEMPE